MRGRKREAGLLERCLKPQDASEKQEEQQIKQNGYLNDSDNTSPIKARDIQTK